MKIDKYSIDGKQVGQVDVADSVFAVKINKVLIYEYIKAANANLRQGTHKTKERAEVRGGGAKPWRKKGTGRARAGTSRSPIWKGGGTVFGPRPRSYRTDLPKKIKQQALRSIFSLKAKEGLIRVIEDFEVESGKTRDMAKIFKSLSMEKGVLVSGSDNKMTKRAIRNIKNVKFNNSIRLSGRELFYSKNIVITESAVTRINDKLAKGN